MTSCTTFSQFSSLPPELRLRIWTFSLPGPRLVSLNYTEVSSDVSNPSTRKFLRGCTSSTLIPTNLHVNREAREHARKHYNLSFNLPHYEPKIWFNVELDVLYFPAREGWLGSWNHFVNAVTLMEPWEVGRVKRLAVSEGLFKGVKGASQGLNLRATCVNEFWDYVKRKFVGLDELVVVVDPERKEDKHDDVMVWMEDVLGCAVRKETMGIGSGEDRLVKALERELKRVEEKDGWRAPRWDVLRFPGAGDQIEGWPLELLENKSCGLQHREKMAMLERIVIPHRNAVPKVGSKFWMGGDLPFWYQMASQSVST